MKGIFCFKHPLLHTKWVVTRNGVSFQISTAISTYGIFVTDVTWMFSVQCLLLWPRVERCGRIAACATIPAKRRRPYRRPITKVTNLLRAPIASSAQPLRCPPNLSRPLQIQTRIRVPALAALSCLAPLPPQLLLVLRIVL